ncbi:hypothetical protein OOZ15_16440 [Galbibacter sp. EGI 63066]|uniref:hypothetical protein n=1 Tax=Galbibacter sp. EGI 63066 TaxID=2993559 RepID=UPI002248F69D|nr:hypothetical protein [Galbibacter sp. EGI 63066]MCX2681544.1 hypothetical protein [Galbibacter sp. EGI 63066]
MEITFTTKEITNKEQQAAFLALKPTERFYAFLNMAERLKDFPSKAKGHKKKANFLIEIRRDGKQMEREH